MNIIGWLGFITATFLLGVTVIVIVFYSRRKNHHLSHIAWMGVSYLILVFLIAFTINYRIFYDGVSRQISIVLSFIAYICGAIGLYLMVGKVKK